MGKIMVTGALGNVGGYVAKYAIQQGDAVRCADIHVEALRAKYGAAAESVRFDFTDPATFAPALAEWTGFSSCVRPTSASPRI